MTRILTSVFVFFFLLTSGSLYGQTVTVTTGIPNSPSSLGATQAGMTFVIINNNSYPMILKTMDVYTAATQSGATFYLKYSSTSLSGPPTGAGSWTTAATATAPTITSTAIYPMFTNINLTIPANTTYRFLVHNSVSSFNYGGATTTPNSHTNGGITIGTGNYQISGQNVGYSGATPNYNSFNPRFWGGTITLEPAIATNVSATSVLTPANNSSFCYNLPVDVKVVVKNKGSQPQSNFPVNAYYSGNAGSGTISVIYTPTLAPGASDTVLVGAINPSPGSYQLVGYTAMVNDSLKSDDTSGVVNFTSQPPVPLPDVVSDTVCPGHSVQLDVSSNNSNATFKWFSQQSGGTLLTTGNSVFFTSIAQDTTMWVVAVIGNCESDRVPIHGAIGPPPVVNLGNDTSFCESIPLILNAGNPGGIYTWSNGDSAQTISVTNQSGNYWVLVDKYCTASDTISVTIRPMPFVSGISYVRMANTYHFQPSFVQNVESYLWIFGDGNTSTDSTPVHTYASSVNVALQVKLIVGNTCGYDTVARTVPTGVGGPEGEHTIKIYPNPANDQLFVQSPDVRLSTITIVNMMGSVVLRQPADAELTTLDIRHLAAGNYIIRLSSPEGDAGRPLQIVR